MEASPFYKLPGEIRNRIYELALHHPGGLTIRILTGTPHLLPSSSTDTAYPSSCNSNSLALPLTCNQLHRETLPLLFSLNKFTLIARPLGQRYNLEIWQKGLHAWLRQIGEVNRRLLREVEIDIGTSFMYDFYPTSETLWRSVSSLLHLFNTSVTRVSMRTEICWMSRSRRAFEISIPLNDPVVAKEAVARVLEGQRKELERWFTETRVCNRDAGYRRVELETSGQELRSFVSLLETGVVVGG